MNTYNYRNKTNAKIEHLYNKGTIIFQNAKTSEEEKLGIDMVIAGLDTAIAATRNHIERHKKENEIY